MTELKGKNVSAQAWLRAIERHELEGRQPRKVNGPIGYVGVALARIIAARARGGVLRASPKDLAADSAHARSAINAAIARLRDCGFLAYERGARGRRATFEIRLPEAGHDGAVDRRSAERGAASEG